MHEDAHAESSALAQLSLLVDEDWYAAPTRLRRHLVEHVTSVVREEQVLKIRHARLLGWMKGKDLGPIDYSSWTAFCVEHSLWKGSRMREILRLIASDLDTIKLLVACGVLPLTLATRAAKELDPKASTFRQMDWLSNRDYEPVPKRHRTRMQQVVGKDVRIIETARAIGKVLVGWSAPVEAIDRFIVECFTKQLTNEQMLERARAVPPRPPRLDQEPPEWEREPKPPIAGEWVAPKDQQECLDRLKENRLRLERRRMILGMAYVGILDHELWRLDPGCTSLQKFCTDKLDLDQRTFQRYAREGRDFLLRPEARKAVDAGMTVDRACFAIAHGWNEDSLTPWLDLASRLDCAEMARAEELQEPVDVAYGPAVEMAKQVESILGGGEATPIGGGEATPIGGVAGLIAQHVQSGRTTPIGGVIRVALRDATYRGQSPPPPSTLLVPPELVPAARWFVETAELPKEVGIRTTVVHDRHCCQNPRCRRITIRLHTHHIEPQALGRNDAAWNLIALCPSCHLRGIHSGWMRLVRFGDWLVWTWPDGGVAITHSPMDGAPGASPRR